MISLVYEYVIYILQNIHQAVKINVYSESVSRSVVSDSLQSHGLYSARFLCSRDSPGKNTGMRCHSLLQGIFLTQGLNLGILHCRQILYCLSHQGSPITWLINAISYYCFSPHHLIHWSYLWSHFLKISLVGGKLLYSVVLVSPVQQHELVKIRIFPPSWASIHQPILPL